MSDDVLPLFPPKKQSTWPDPVMNFLIAYDVADPKRLRAVARNLENVARRVQKSVFVYSGTRAGLESVISALAGCIDPSADRIQAWPIRTSTKACRVDAGAALPETGVALIVTGDQWFCIEAIDEPATAASHEPLIID